MEKFKYILLLLFIYLVAPTCLDPTQTNGECTTCSPIEVIVNGYCFVKLRGCLQYNNQGKCEICQFGYVKQQGLCIRQAEFRNNTDNTPAPLVPGNNGALTLEDIKNMLGQLYGDKFPYVHQYMLQNHPIIGKGQISSVETLQTKTSMLFNFIYISDQSKFEAIASIDSLNKVQELYFAETNPQKQANIIQAINFIRDTLGDRLINHEILKIKKKGNNFQIDFIDQNNNVLRAKLPKQSLFVTNPIQLAVSVSIADLTLFDLANQAVLSQFSILSKYRLIKSQKVGQYIILYYDEYQQEPGVSVSVRYKDYKFLINTPILQVDQTDQNIDDEFYDFNDESDPRYIASLQYASVEFPQIIDTKLVKTQSQIVDGINFIFTFYNTQEQSTYKIKVFYSLKGQTSLLEAYKNQKQLFTFLHNYNIDNLFLINYPTALQKIKISNVPRIVIVSRKKILNQSTYKVSYKIDEYFRFKINQNTGQITVLEYYLDGIDLNGNPLLQKRSPEELLAFLREKKPITVGGKTSQISYNLPYYTLKIVISTGTYVSIIEDKGQQLILVQYNKISSRTCYELTISDIQSDSTIQQIDNKLRSLYPLGSFNIQLVQAQILPQNQIKYRLLYSNTKLQQIQIYLFYNEKNQVRIEKASLLNFGFQIQTSSNSSNQIQQLAISSIEKRQNKTYQPFFTELNSNFVRTFYETGQKTVQLTIDRTTNVSYSFFISNKDYITIPDGFSIKNIVIPEVEGLSFSEQIKNICRQIVNQAHKKYPFYISEPTIKFAQYQKRVNFQLYTILIRTNRGYIRIVNQVTQDSNKIKKRRLISLVITRYSDGDFSDCQKLTLNQKCSQCPRQKLLYQDSCFERIDGCLIQPGGQCIKCNADYIQRDYKCIKECSAFLF